jgi:ADP-heptose:LPS heptosyltransferase
MLGGPADQERFQSIAETYSNVISLAGLTSLHESAYVIKQSTVAIATDTGMMHIAAAFKKPMVSIWGSTIPTFGMYPYYGDELVVNHISEVDNLSCRPCSKIGFKKCPKKHFNCMKMQNVEQIVYKVKEYIDI